MTFTRQQLLHILSNLTRYKVPDRQTTFKIIMMAVQYHKNFKNYVSLDYTPNSHVYFIGDLHGQYEDMLHILQIIEDERLQSPSTPIQLVFLGDVVDRGYRSLETLLTVLCMQLLWPGRVHLLRGNHETEKISRIYGFFDECKRKHASAVVYLECLQLFQTLPVALILEYKESAPATEEQESQSSDITSTTVPPQISMFCKAEKPVVQSADAS